MTSSQRIAVNTLAAYSRSLVAVALGLFSSRWVLAALGQTDYGLYCVIGSVVLFLTMLNATLTISTSRFLAYSIGQNNPRLTTCWFNVALGLHIALSLVILLVGWPLGEYVIRFVLNIPPERVADCVCVFRMVFCTALANVLSVPFVSMFTAKQRIAEVSLWGIVQTGLVFIFAWYLLRVPQERLLVYAGGVASITVCVLMAQCIQSAFIFDEVRIVPVFFFAKKKLKALLAFASCDVVGFSGVTFGTQGGAFLLNFFFGPQANAAYGIANQVSAQASALSSSLFAAFVPEIISAEGGGQRDRMLSLALRACKFCALLVMMFAIPLVTEIEYVLGLWLVTPPPYTGVFCRIILLAFVLDKMTFGLVTAVHAHGVIAAFQTIYGLINACTVVIAFILIKHGVGPASVSLASLGVALGSAVFRVRWFYRTFGVPPLRWARDVAWPCVAVGAVAFVVAAGIKALLPVSIVRLLLVCGLSASATVLVAWQVALNTAERQFVLSNMANVRSRIRFFLGVRG